MMQDGSTGEAVYLRLKAALIDCAIDPHSRLDVARVADRFEVSATPVREAAMRLLGEGLLERHPSGGTRPLQTSEYGLRSMLELHGHLTEMAVRIIGNGAIALGPSDAQIAPETRERQFFGAIAQATGIPDVIILFDHYADRLAPYRRVEPEILTGLQLEFEMRHRAAMSGDTPALRKGVRSYHRRRLAVVPQLAWHVARRQFFTP